MGAALSRIRLAFITLHEIIQSYRQLEHLLRRSPGLPHPYPTQAFWTVPRAEIANNRSQLPKHADVVIIGSGISGASIARVLLDAEDGPGVVMLEAREACSGATGRNGGHINPIIYQDFPSLLKTHGVQTAKNLIQFRLAHFAELLAVAEEEGILNESQCREVEACDVYLDRTAWRDAKEKLACLESEMSLEAKAFRVYEKSEAIETFHLSDDTEGCITTRAGAVHPYRLVTGILTRLLSSYPDNFYLLTNTPCTSISAPSNSSRYYTVHTPEGDITASHVIHCTNAYTSHLLAPMRTKIIPLRGTMSTQRPGESMRSRGCTLSGSRAFVFYGAGYDYLTQMPSGEQELMLGGGILQAGREGMLEVGVTDDGTCDVAVAAHLSGVLPVYFGLENWGSEGSPSSIDRERDQWPKGRVKALWSGIIGVSADGLPWVGRVPVKLSGRKTPCTTAITREDKFRCGQQSASRLAEPGEWICGGYSGEGMVHAWLAGKAVGYMVLRREAEVDWLPDVMRVSERRWRNAKIEGLVDAIKR